jgi:hypothetical protein
MSDIIPDVAVRLWTVIALVILSFAGIGVFEVIMWVMR